MIPLVDSFSGGRTSGFMTRYLQLRYPNRKILYVFANTGREKEETLRFVNECDMRWGLGVIWVEWRAKYQLSEVKVNKTRTVKREIIIEHDEAFVNPKGFEVVSFETANRDGSVFREMVKRYGLPNKSYPHCTRELKRNTINRYVRSVLDGEYETAIGYRIDEQHRANYEPGQVYPLIDEIQVDKLFVRNWWAKQEFDLELNELEGNCDLCYKKSIRKKLTLIKQQPTIADFWLDLEAQFSEGKWYLHQGATSTAELVEMAKMSMELVEDEFEKKPNLFGLFDREYDCMCKST